MFMRNAIAILNNWVRNNVFHFVGYDAPLSGTSGTGVNVCGPGSTYIDITRGVKYINEGSSASPYWTPINFQQAGLLSWFSDFRDGIGEVSSATNATATIPGSGIRVFGQGIAETDSGFPITIAEGGPVGALTTTDETAHLAALGVGITTSVPFQPDTHGPLVVDAEVAMSSAITARSLFLGFLGTLADALDPPVTATTITATLVQDDLAGVIYDSALTDADRLYAAHNKSNEAATQDVTTGGRDTGVDFPAADIYTRLRVQISLLGHMTLFKDKVQIGYIENALDVDEEVGPCLLVRATATAVKVMLVKRFAAWGNRA